MELGKYRKEKGLTMRRVSRLAKINESTYNLIEHGKRRPSVDAAKRIAAVLGFNWTAFFPEVPEIQPPKEE